MVKERKTRKRERNTKQKEIQSEGRGVINGLIASPLNPIDHYQESSTRFVFSFFRERTRCEAVVASVT